MEEAKRAIIILIDWLGYGGVFEMSSGENRVKWADAFRAIMILAIAYGHAAPGGDLKKYVYSFHVAAFFFVSGYFFKTSGLSFGQFAWKKFKSLMIPYYSFAVISILVFFALGSFASDKLDVAIKTADLMPNVLGMLWANGRTGYMKWNLPLWFIPCLFATELAAYPCVKRISEKGGSKSKMLLSAGALVIALSVLNDQVLHVYGLPFHFETTVFMLPFFIMGLLCRERKLLPEFHHALIGPVCICAGYALAVYANSSVDYVTSSYGNICVFYLAAGISIIGFAGIARMLHVKALYYLGRNSLPVLLMHKFPIVALQIVFSALISRTDAVGFAAAILITVISCAACLAVDIPLKRYLPFIYGRK